MSMEDWGAVRARLGRWIDHPVSMIALHDLAADIRVALEEVREWRRFAFAFCAHPMKYGDDGEMQCNGTDFRRADPKVVIAHLVAEAQAHSAALRQRVEELEQTIKAVLDRALAAEKRAEAAEKRVEEQQRELEQTTVELRRVVDELADARVTEAGLVKRVEELEREIERLKALGLERQEWRSRMGLSTQDVIVQRAEAAEAKLLKANEDIVYMSGKLNDERAKLARCVEALEPFIRRHCGLCVPVDEQGRMGEVTTESCVCDADQKQARAALAAAKGE